MDDVRVYSGTLVVDLILPHARSIKDRRKVLQSLIQRLRNRDLAVAQVGPTDLIQRAFVAVAAVSSSEASLQELLDGAERRAFASGFEVADVRRNTSSETFSST